jgi:protein-S-isoprenylcysteine O-methyltransferase Ste14
MSPVPAFELGLWNAWIFVLCGYFVPFLLMSGSTGKAALKRLNVSVPIQHEKVFNVVSTAIMVAGVIYSIFLPLQLGTLWFFMGFVIFLVALVISLSATFFVRTTPADQPFTKGPYRYSRHPYYVAETLLSMSIAIASVSWVFLMLTVIMSIFHLIAAPAEEQYCLKRYGQDYQEYMNRTPRWIGIPKTRRRD